VHYLVFRCQNQAGNFRNVGNTRFRSADNMFPDSTNFGIPNVLFLICDEQRKKNYVGLTLQIPKPVRTRHDSKAVYTLRFIMTTL